jgi:hypothetical protein
MAKIKKVTADEIYNLLLNEFKIKEQIGSVEIIRGGISAKYNGKDAIGDLLQEWLGEWLKQKKSILNNIQTLKNFQIFYFQKIPKVDI